MHRPGDLPAAHGQTLSQLCARGSSSRRTARPTARAGRRTPSGGIAAIAGGSDFSAEIAARAAKPPRVVLVAWSKASVASHWVKDEAAEGRDRGRLVPLLLDRTMPPLGYRQIQAVEPRRMGRNGPPRRLRRAAVAAIDLVGELARPPGDGQAGARAGRPPAIDEGPFRSYQWLLRRPSSPSRCSPRAALRSCLRQPTVERAVTRSNRR